MSLLSFLRGKLVARPAQRHHERNRNSVAARATQSETRREMVRLALRDMQTRHGIPASWIDFDVLWLSKSKGVRAPTMHVRLLIKHLEPQLLAHGLSFQRGLLKRVSLFDPRASGWLGGISWQFAVPENMPCPELRGPGLRGESPTDAQPAAAQPGPKAGTPAGPSVQAQLDELRRLFATGDAERALASADAGAPSGFEDTRPFELREPAGR
jgi:hypothetical protein